MKTQIQIEVTYEHHASYFYYPSMSCKTKDGEMKMLIKELEKSKEPYTLKIRLYQE